MHEFSVMSQIVESILEEARKNRAIKVEGVELEIGEYTMLGKEQLRFAFEVLTKDTIIEGAELVIKDIRGRVRCPCGYEGHVPGSDETPHRMVPILECPRCGGAAEILEGRECLLRNIRMVVPDA